MSVGNVVEYWQGKDLALGFCVGEENKNKLPIMTATGKKDSLASKKVLFSHKSPLGASASREDILQHLDSVKNKKNSEAEDLDTAELWELLLEEDPAKEWALSELADYLFSGECGKWELSVLYRALYLDKHRYVRKGDAFKIRSAEQVAEAAQREAVEKQREAERTAIKAWLAQVWEKRDATIEGPHQDSIQTWRERVRKVAIKGEDASHYQHVMRFLKELDGKRIDLPFEFMVRLGEWTQDQNVEILTNETPLEFAEDVLSEARSASELLEEVLAETERIDLTEWECHSIDDPDTTEIDDALAWRECDAGVELAIHIADASSFLRPEYTALEAEIKERATSVYLPDLKVRMVPKVLSDEVMSLQAGVVRPAFSFLVTLDPEGKLLESSLSPTRIRVSQRLDYDYVDKAVADGDDYWVRFADIGRKLKAQREAAGAVNLPFRRMNVELEQGKIKLVPDERGSIAQTIVSELMILANRVAADYLTEHELPAIYRSQKAPDPPIEMRAEWKPHHLYEARKSFSRSAQGFQPAPHSGLGLERYVQATSPIRRYRDLVHQRQLKNHLKTGEKKYSKECLEEILTLTSTPVSQAERMERNRKSYFLHKLLKGQRGEELEAVILAVTGERYTLQLTESLREIDVPRGNDKLRSPGDLVKVKVLSVYPRDRVLKVSSPLP